MPLLTLQELESLSPLFRGKVGRITGRCVMRMLAINRLNQLYDRHAHLCGSEFAHSVLHDLGIHYHVFADKAEVLTQLNQLSKNTPFITISNHPYGSIDGVILADYFGHLCPHYKLMANSLLGRVSALSSSFIPVTPVGAEHRPPTTENVLGMRHTLMHLRQGGALGLFPAGAVSDFSLRDRCVRDREWQHSIIRLIAKAEVPILPVRFFDGNSPFYYLLGLIDWRVRLLRLPAEVFNKACSPVRIGVGMPVEVEQQHQFLATHTIEEFGQWLRSKVYDMTIENR